MATGVQQVKARWAVEPWSGHLGEVVDALAHGRNLPDLELPRWDDRVDLRGLPLPEPVLRSVFFYANPKLRRPHPMGQIAGKSAYADSTLAHIDLSYSNIHLTDWDHVTFRDVLFREADASEVHFSGCVFEDVDFGKASLREASLGGYLGTDLNAYRRTSFARADMRHTYHRPSLYEDCDFSRAKLDGVDFDGSRFVRCKFAGKLSEVWFHGSYARPPEEDLRWFERARVSRESLVNTMEAVDFSEAYLQECMFVDRVDLSRCRFPVDRIHILIRNRARVLDALERELRAKWSDPARAGALSLLRIFRGSPEQIMTVVNREDYEKNPRIPERERDPWMGEFFDLMATLESELG